MIEIRKAMWQGFDSGKWRYGLDDCLYYDNVLVISFKHSSADRIKIWFEQNACQNIPVKEIGRFVLSLPKSSNWYIVKGHYDKKKYTWSRCF